MRLSLDLKLTLGLQTTKFKRYSDTLINMLTRIKKKMSTSKDKTESIRTLPFSGKAEDYNMWSKQFMALARRKQYKDALIGKLQVPKESETLDPNKQQDEIKAREANEKAYGDLLLSCTDEVSFSIIDSSTSKDLPSGDAAMAWAKLGDKYEPKTGSNRTLLKREFVSSKMQQNQDPDEWITQLEILRAKIEKTGGNLSDEDLLIHVLNNLTTDYESMVELYERQLTIGSVTLSDVRNGLNSKYLRLKNKKVEGNESETALFVKTFKGKCRNCGKQGHKSVDCWEKEENKHKRPKNYTTEKKGKGRHNPNIICYNCKEKGHIKSKCPKLKEETVMVTETQEEEIVLTAGQPKNKNTNVWIGDSGATCHMRSDTIGMYEMKEVNQEIRIGDGKGLQAKKIGKWKGYIEQVDGTTRKVILDEVVFVPGLCVNLFSLTKAMKNGYKIGNDEKVITLTKNNTEIKFDRIQTTKVGYLVGIKMIADDNEEQAELAGIGFDQAHQMLGHAGENYVKNTAIKLGWKVEQALQKCESCPIAKARQKNTKKETKREVKEKGDMFSSDISSIKGTAFNGGKYWLLVVDSKTKMKWSFF